MSDAKAVGTTEAEEANWTAPKLIGIGAVTLIAAFIILHILSGTDCVPGFC